MIIRTRNTLADKAPKTYLTQPVGAGTSVLGWKNPTGFAASWAVQVGETGEEQTEVLLLSASTPGGTAGTVTGTTLYAHPADTPIYGIKYDQVVFERSTVGTAGTAAAISNGTIGYMADGTVTFFDDTTGASTYAYKTLFRNSVLAVNTSESDWITSSGFSFYSLAALRTRARGRLWNATYLTDDILNDWINEWKDEMTNAVISVNENYALGTVDVPFSTNGLGTITTTDFSQVKRVWVTYNGSDYFKSTKMESTQFLPDQQFNSTMPYHYYEGDTVLGVKPEQSGGTARIEFYRFGTTMVNDTDVLPQPFRSHTKSFIDYMEGLSLKKDGKYEEAEPALGRAESGMAKFVSQVSPRDKTGQEYIDIKEATSGDDYYPF